jgi:hypothetical protein
MINSIQPVYGGPAPLPDQDANANSSDAVDASTIDAITGDATKTPDGEPTSHE